MRLIRGQSLARKLLDVPLDRYGGDSAWRTAILHLALVPSSRGMAPPYKISILPASA
jgi:hypothetical protein